MSEKPLVDLVLQMADRTSSLSEDAKLLVLAAMQGADELAEALDSPSAIATGAAEAAVAADTVEPVGAYLTGIEVAGFRGIGPAATLPLRPGAGLTVVVGRNGCGKSSFAEALELALTGDSYRWRDRSAVWTANWRNLHRSEPCHVRVGLTVDDVGAVTVGLDWKPEHGLTERAAWSQRAGRPREHGIGGLGWGAAMEVHRPLLSYEEMGRLLEAKPSEMHDALAAILGLEQVTDAARRLRDALRQRQEPERRAKELRAELLVALAACDDDRAGAALAHVRSTKPDLDAVAVLVSGGGADASATVHRLSALAAAPGPDEAEVARVVDDLVEAIAAAEDDGSVAVRLVERRSALVEHAMRVHDDEGDGPCPVCGRGTLDAWWRERAATELARDRATVLAVRNRKDALDRAVAAARALAGGTPVLPDPPPGVPLPAYDAAAVAVERWRATPATAAELVAHLTREAPVCADALAMLRAAAADALTRAHDSWAPIAGRLATWIDVKRQVNTASATTRTLDEASKWIRLNEAELRNERMRPLAARSREIWSALRQESNVDLGEVTLAGQSTRRHVSLTAEVDGRPAGALGVMSQGELHALALALFLPRATAAESPLRFVVLDDPVQAMDPSKVDGLVTVLDDIARDRQVVVFSHDDRLADAVRRMAVDAVILEVSRDAESVVHVRRCLDPARRHVEDAFAVAADDHLEPDVKARVLPGLCRVAVESAARDVHYARRFRDGATRDVLEAEWQGARGVTAKVALALHGDPRADITGWRMSARARHRNLAMTVVGKGVHEGLRTNPLGAAEAVRSTVDDLLRDLR